MLAKDLCLLGEAVGQLEVAFEIAPAASARGVCLRSGVVAATSRAAPTPIRLVAVVPVNFPFVARGLSRNRGFLREGGRGLGGKIALRRACSAVRALVVCVFAVFAAVGIAVDALSLFRTSVSREGKASPDEMTISVVRASVAALLVLAGIFVMRFSFYMMHMTVGISF